jgi:hypothetical protein
MPLTHIRIYQHQLEFEVSLTEAWRYWTLVGMKDMGCKAKPCKKYCLPQSFRSMSIRLFELEVHVGLRIRNSNHVVFANPTPCIHNVLNSSHQIPRIFYYNEILIIPYLIRTCASEQCRTSLNDTVYVRPQQRGNSHRRSCALWAAS